MEGKDYVEPNYYAIIPASVRYDKNLSASQKIFYGEIVALSTKNGTCTASNNYFASLYNVVPSSISNWIKQLELLKYIKVDYVYKENSKEIEKRIIKIVGIQNSDKVFNKLQEGIQKKSEGYSKNTKENNTSNNNTSFNKKENIKRKVFTKPTLEDLKDYCTNSNLKVDCQHFYDYYESNGWKVGKNSMKDWKATLRNWNRNNFNKSNNTYKTAYERTKENMAVARKEIEARERERRTS